VEPGGVQVAYNTYLEAIHCPLPFMDPQASLLHRPRLGSEKTAFLPRLVPCFSSWLPKKELRDPTAYSEYREGKEERAHLCF
jgi:hypothetical protein